MKFFTLDNFSFKGRRVLVRVDINSPLTPDKKVVDNDRISSAAKVVRELSLKQAKVVVLGHQGRFGDDDYLDIDSHAALLSKHAALPVNYVDSLTDISTKIRGMKNGQILVLKNVRSLPEETKELSAEEHHNSSFISALEPLFDYYVNDAFSVSHRSHASIVGFTSIPNIAGRQMEYELNNLNNVVACKHPYVCVFGGAKPNDVYKLLKYGLESRKIDYALCAGFLGMNLLMARGVNLGASKKFIEEKNFVLPDVQNLLKDYEKRIVLPVDVAVDDNGRKELLVQSLPSNKMIDDIGSKTISEFVEKIKKAKTIYLKGPMGMYENEEFAKGTKAVFDAVLSSGAFIIAGGGHTVDAIEEMGLDASKISYLSLAGGALVSFMAGEKLPGITALESSYMKFKNLKIVIKEEKVAKKAKEKPKLKKEKKKKVKSSAKKKKPAKKVKHNKAKKKK